MTRPTTACTTSRREFLARSTGTAAGAALASLSIARTAHAAGDDLIRIALIGCGGRGVGAAVNALGNAGHENVKLVALADAFQDRVDFAKQALTKRFPDKVDVPEERQFSGLDCYVGAMAAGANVVLLCGPPGFRPVQFEAAVNAGKHVFMEKPVATDAPGVRRIMAANEQAKQKKLAVSVGHHLR
ncbi:MAG: Gfo/Idh/MocA family oxidoreductase, partial [Patescibacteria group bacterium]|nr:Gfo/Idh/MocA family oxidoreductase [Patescibacteria group bacterium]